jgi:hypothetical protein
VPQEVPERPEEGVTGSPNTAADPAKAGTWTGATDRPPLVNPVSKPLKWTLKSINSSSSVHISM